MAASLSSRLLKGIANVQAVGSSRLRENIGFVHLYNGHEVVPSGFIKLLTESDSVVGTSVTMSMRSSKVTDSGLASADTLPMKTYTHEV